MPSYEFKLPDIGEGIAEGEVVKWFVSEGDIIKEDQPLVEVMTDKVNVEIPSPKAGKISRIVAGAGQVVKVGEILVIFEVGSEEAIKDSNIPIAKSTAKPPTSQLTPSEAPKAVLAAPSTRKLARELGVDLTKVLGTGPGGRITVDDVKRHSQKPVEAIDLTIAPPSQQVADERIPLRGLRKIIAERMSKSAHTAAQVTHVDEADVTELVQLKNRLTARMDESGKKTKITFLPLLIKAIIPALKEFPFINAWFDDQKQEIVVKKSYNIGIATDTEQGLIVPVIKDVQRKDVFEIAVEIENLVEKGRTGKLSLDDVRGSTFTVTNVGSIGGLYSTPLVYYPEAAILGIQKIVKKPAVKNDNVVIREIMNLSLSFDHRVIDGAYAARFTNRVIREIENPSSIV